jgi:hypothetical protein
VVAVSVAIWICLARNLVAVQNRVTRAIMAVAFGLVSPILGGLAMMPVPPFFGVIYVVTRPRICLPVGAATGLLVYLAFACLRPDIPRREPSGTRAVPASDEHAPCD